MPATDIDRIVLSGSAKIDLQTMGLPLDVALDYIREAILGKATRTQLNQAQGIMEAKLSIEDGQRCIGLLYIDEPDAKFLVARVYWTRQ